MCKCKYCGAWIVCQTYKKSCEKPGLCIPCHELEDGLDILKRARQTIADLKINTDDVQLAIQEIEDRLGMSG